MHISAKFVRALTRYAYVLYIQRIYAFDAQMNNYKYYTINCDNFDLPLPQKVWFLLQKDVAIPLY